MWNEYTDIRERLGDPRWFDETGVPRYCAFAPSCCSVYARAVAFVEIACQACGECFLVAAVPDLLSCAPDPTAEEIGAFHYGDPPRHGCIGDTMNSEPVEIREFWRRDLSTTPRLAWVRVPACEFLYPRTDR